MHQINWHLAGGLCLCAYAIGCFTAGYYFVRVRTGQDIRDIGSGSVGAKNVGRVLGKAAFCFTLFFDLAKGAFAVWLAQHFTTDNYILALAMLSVVVGHIWPIQLLFHGGKGMATSLSALLIYDPRLVLAFAVVFLCTFPLLRRTVLPGLFAFACLPIVGFFLNYDSIKVTLICMLVGLVLVAHRKNLAEEFFQLVHRNAHSKSDLDL